MLHALSTIKEIEAAIAAGTATYADALVVLAPRTARKNSQSGKRAARWIVANAPGAKSVPAPTPRTPTKSRKGRGGSLAFWEASAKTALAHVEALRATQVVAK